MLLVHRLIPKAAPDEKSMTTFFQQGVPMSSTGLMVSLNWLRTLSLLKGSLLVSLLIPSGQHLPTHPQLHASCLVLLEIYPLKLSGLLYLLEINPLEIQSHSSYMLNQDIAVFGRTKYKIRMIFCHVTIIRIILIDIKLYQRP